MWQEVTSHRGGNESGREVCRHPRVKNEWINKFERKYCAHCFFVFVDSTWRVLCGVSITEEHKIAQTAPVCDSPLVQRSSVKCHTLSWLFVEMCTTKRGILMLKDWRSLWGKKKMYWSVLDGLMGRGEDLEPVLVRERSRWRMLKPVLNEGWGSAKHGSRDMGRGRLEQECVQGGKRIEMHWEPESFYNIHAHTHTYH